MLERSYLLPLWDRSWSKDTLVRFEYMDEPPSGKEIDAQLMRGGAPLSVVTGTTIRKQLLAQATPRRRVALPNGFESWQYALKPAAAAIGDPLAQTDLVVLIDPDGIVRKARVREPWSRPFLRGG